jgi:predicted AAA+ superfamily ATPase
MRGRALEVLVHPFSFREALRHAGHEPAQTWGRLPKAVRSALHASLDGYLEGGGFPEAQGVTAADRASLLRSYVDVGLLRDVIERHSFTHPTAARWVLRELLGNPAGTFSVEKLHRVLKSGGLHVAKETVHALIDHFEDAFLVRTVGLHSASPRRRQVNPRKAYPVDPGLIALHERADRPNTGHALETVVCLELERRGAVLGYVRTEGDHEVDFHARLPDGTTWLIQVCADASDPATLSREIRGLSEARQEHPSATPLLLTLGPVAPEGGLPPGLYWQPSVAWLLGEAPEAAARR